MLILGLQEAAAHAAKMADGRSSGVENPLLVGGVIIFAGLEHDGDAENPLESFDGNGRIYSRCRRHGNYRDDLSAVGAAEGGGFVVALGYFEHGACIWHVSAERPAGTEGDYRWDGVSDAGIWVPDKYALEDIKGRPKGSRCDRALELARQACTAYTAWCNGECYRFSLAAYRARYKDGSPYDDADYYRLAEPLAEDGCGGYYGRDDACSAMGAALVELLKRITGKENADGKEGTAD